MNKWNVIPPIELSVKNFGTIKKDIFKIKQTYKKII